MGKTERLYRVELGPYMAFKLLWNPVKQHGVHRNHFPRKKRLKMNNACGM